MKTQFRGYQRCARIDYANGNNAFAVTICVKPRRSVFVSEERNARVVEEVLRLQEEGACGVYAYCVMPDHIHVILNPGARGLSEAVRRFKARLATWWRRTGDGLSLWQDGYFDHRIRVEESFGEKCRYVLDNPVRAGLVQNPTEYRWSGVLAHR